MFRDTIIVGHSSVEKQKERLTRHFTIHHNKIFLEGSIEAFILFEPFKTSIQSCRDGFKKLPFINSCLPTFSNESSPDGEGYEVHHHRGGGGGGQGGAGHRAGRGQQEQQAGQRQQEQLMTIAV